MTSLRFLNHCLSTPWAMEPTAMSLYAAMLARGYAGASGPPAAPIASRPRTGATPRSIAVVRVFGAIVQRASQLGPCEGGIGTEDIGAALSAALADETVSQILIQFDTPGGSVFGVAELGDQIRAARAQKPIIGIADSMAASAGYWLLSQCTEAYCTPGGLVGSIGVYGAHQDISRAMEDAGIKTTLISAGKYKVEGSPYEPLGDEARANMQESIDTYYSMFTSAVAKGRGVPIATVRNGMGEGRVLNAEAALAQKMIDGVRTLPQVIQRMQAPTAKSLSKPNSAQAVFASRVMSARARRNELELLLLEAS